MAQFFADAASLLNQMPNALLNSQQVTVTTTSPALNLEDFHVQTNAVVNVGAFTTGNASIAWQEGPSSTGPWTNIVNSTPLALTSANANSQVAVTGLLRQYQYMQAVVTITASGNPFLGISVLAQPRSESGATVTSRSPSS